MPYVLDGTLGMVQIEALGTKHVISFSADPIRQVPVISVDRGSGSVHSGTSVTVRWPDSSCSLLYEVCDLFVQVARFYTFLNPHLSLTLEAFDDEPIEIEATNPSWVKWRPPDPTSPHWYKLEHLNRLIAGYLAVSAPRHSAVLNSPSANIENGHKRTTASASAREAGPMMAETTARCLLCAY
jgi:hypothetical protein